MNCVLILAAYFFLLSADEARGLFLTSLFKDENSLQSKEGGQGSAAKFSDEEHRFLIPPKAEGIKEPNQPLPRYLGRDPPEKGFPDNYQTIENGHSSLVGNGRIAGILGGDSSSSAKGKQTGESWRKANSPISSWNGFYLRAPPNLSRNIYTTQGSKDNSPESRLDNKMVAGESDMNSRVKNLETYFNSLISVKNSKNKNQIHPNFVDSPKINKTSMEEEVLRWAKPVLSESLKYPSQMQESLNNVKFPEKEIISKFYSMIQSVDKLQKMKEGNFNNDETLPEAQRRYAKENFFPEDEMYKHLWNKKWDFQRIHYTTITVGTLMLFLILVVMILALRVHCRTRDKSTQEWIRHPVVQPATATSDAIQPTFQHILQTDHLNAEPIRIKAKGLLERRGSNTSLTIDLGPTNEGADVIFSPSRECMNENFLMTAGNRMSRRQLRICLKDHRNLHAEFWQIPTNHPDKCSVPGAAAKNRYRTVLPNEETRVVLHRAPPDSPETPASQYINANYIRGFDGEDKAYIATQGPLAHTVEDLWLLALQERSPAIVMITRLKEKGRVKCEPYIPSYSASYGSIQVTVKQVVQKNGYTIRQIYLKRGDEVHTTLHFWFTSWPDHKTPSSARHLLAMSSEVEMARKENGGPAIVHCSAGIGRTGCFIAVNIGIKQLLEEDCVDVLNIVCQMRLDRGGMVQTAEQYEFIHRALALSEASLPYITPN